MSDSAIPRFLKELRRRRVFRVAGLYVIGAWLALQAANILFPGWGVPGEAIRYLFWAVLLGFPVALVFGWIFEITPEGIQRTRPEWSAAELEEALPLGRRDYLILAAFVIVIGLIVYDATGRVLRTAVDEAPVRVAAELIENAVAVLPFANLSPDPEQEYFADGISEEILNRLSGFDELTVIARTSSFAFKDSGFDVRRICELLGVEYLLQGSVRRDNGQIRVAAQLVDHRGAQLWTQTFDRELVGIFAIQDEIAEAVAASIAPQIVPPTAVARLPDIEAFEQYLLGRDLLVRRALDRSVEHFTRAIELDPEFAEPYVERAIATVIGSRLIADHEEALDRAHRDIDTALALRPNLAKAHAAQSLLQSRRDPDSFATQEALLRRALSLDPNNVDALNWLAIVFESQERYDEAEEVLSRAARIDPLAPLTNNNLAMVDFLRGDFAESERRLLRLLDVPQPASMTFGNLRRLYQGTGRLVEAVEITKQWVLFEISDSEHGPRVALPNLAWSYVWLRMWERAEYWRSRASPYMPEIQNIDLDVWIRLYAGELEYSQGANRFREQVDESGADLGGIPRLMTSYYGELQALAGEYEAAIDTLAPLINPESQASLFTRSTPTPILIGIHALAWAWLNAGAGTQAEAMLNRVDENCILMQSDGWLLDSIGLSYCAQNALLLGDTERALELLDQAEMAGWRAYYRQSRDPRWDSVRDHPRFVEIMARVKADIDAQRARMEQIDAEDDFEARLNAALSAREARAAIQ